MNRKLFLLVVLTSTVAASAAAASPRSDLVREILRRVPQWPGTEVEIPLAVYEEYVRELVEGPTPPQPPEVTWVERAAYGLHIGDEETELTAAFDVVRLPGTGGKSLRLLPADLVWRDVTLDGRKVNLRRADDGWFHFDVPEPGRYRIIATAALEPKTAGNVRQIEFDTPPAAWTTGAVDSDGAWDVRFSRSPLSMVGTDAGTRGAAGLAPGDRLGITWRRPQPPVKRAAQIEVESHVGWTLADGVHQVRAILNLRLWGGEAEELVLTLPPRADRIRVTGPDVREVRTGADGARVFLRGAIRQRTLLNVSFESPRPATGRVSLPAFGVVGARNGGGTLGIAGGGGAVILELESPGLEPLALYDLPDEVRGLLAAPPVYAYRIRPGFREARVDLVGMSQFGVRETLIDSALYTVLYRPDGRVMTKVIYEVRNRSQQYMAVDLPPGAELVVARVAEVQRNLARGPAGTVYVPLEKSVLTTAGLVSFPVELVYMMRAEPLVRKGTFRLPLPRADLPVAYARCALMLPDGMETGEWHGVLRRADAWSSETAELEFEYGRGHLAKAPEPKEPPQPKKPDLIQTIAGLFVTKDEAKYKAVLLTSGNEDRRLALQRQMLQGKNLYRAGVDYYARKNYTKAAELFQQAMEVAPKSLEANKARQYLGNISIALGEKVKGEKMERGLRATAKAVQKAQQWGNIDLRERQKRLLTRAEEALRQGDQKQAETAYQVAVNLGTQLTTRGEEAHEQTAVVRKAKAFLAERNRLREEEGKKIAQLQVQVQALQQDIAQTGGKGIQQVVDALVLGDLVSHLEAQSGAVRGPAAVPESGEPVPQVEMDEALAEQQVTLHGRGWGDRRPAGVGGGGYAYTPAPSGGEVEQLKKQLDQLRSIRGRWAAEGEGVERSGDDAPRSAGTDAPVELDLSWEVARKARALKSEARKVTELARQGRLAEAERLVDDLEKKAQITAGAAEVLARRGQVSYGTLAAAGIARVPSRKPEAPVVAKPPVALEPPALGPPTRARSEPAPAGEPERPITAQPDAAPVPLRPSDARRHAVTLFSANELGDVQGALEDVTKAREALEREARRQDKVKFNVADLTVDANGDRRLAEFVERNYAWALRDRGGQVDTSGIVIRDGAATLAFNGRPTAGLPVRIAGGTVILGGQVGFDLTEGQGGIQVDGGSLIVANRPVAVANVEKVLERLRLNLGQRVGVASRNFFVGAEVAKAAGIRWRTGANGVRYAVINEGQLRGVMDVEQRDTGAVAVDPALTRDAYQDAVVGTEALLANGITVMVSRAGDDANTLTYNGNTLQVTHDDYLIVDNGTYLTAVTSGRMQHWSVEAEPVRFPGVPAAVVVPTVGYTVKFEKTLLDASDTLELVADYTWEGEER